MKKIGLLLLIGLYVTACESEHNRHHHTDKFYSEKGGFDWSRIPLVKPYEITTPVRNPNWIVSVTDTSDEVPPNIPGVKDVNVIDSIIVIYSQNTILVGQPVKEAWHVIIPIKKTVRGFENQQGYLEFLDSIKIKKPKLFDITQVFHYFDDKDTLDWNELNRLH